MPPGGGQGSLPESGSRSAAAGPSPNHRVLYGSGRSVQAADGTRSISSAVLRQAGSLLLVAGALVLLVAGVGFLLPAQQNVQRQVVIASSPTAVWRVLVDFPKHAAWRDGVQRLQALSDRSGNAAWRELSNDGERTLEISVSEPGRRLVLGFADERHHFQGVWAFELVEEGNGTRVTLTESGVIENPILRLYCGTIHDRGEALGVLLEELGGELGHNVDARDPSRQQRKPGQIDTLF